MGILDVRATTLKLEELGRWYTGTVTAEPTESQRTEYVKGGGGAPLYWVDKRPTPGVTHDPRTGQPNEPVMQTEIVVEVEELDEYGSKERVLYIDNKRKIAALRAAWRAAGMPRGASMIGCKIAARWSGTEPGDGAQEAKLYEYRIQAPAQIRMRETPPAMPASSPAPATPPVMPSSPPPSMTTAGPTDFSPQCPPGVDSAAWSAMSPTQKGQMYQALGLNAQAPAGARAADPFLDNEPPF